MSFHPEAAQWSTKCPPRKQPESVDNITSEPALESGSYLILLVFALILVFLLLLSLPPPPLFLPPPLHARRVDAISKPAPQYRFNLEIFRKYSNRLWYFQF